MVACLYGKRDLYYYYRLKLRHEELYFFRSDFDFYLLVPFVETVLVKLTRFRIQNFVRIFTVYDFALNRGEVKQYLTYRSPFFP